MKRTKRIAIGVGISFAVYLGVLSILAALIARGAVGEAHMRSGIWISACLAAFAGIKAACPSKDALAIAICAAAVLGTILLTGFLVNGGLDHAQAATVTAAVAAGAGISFLTCAKKGRHTNGKRRFRR